MATSVGSKFLDLDNGPDSTLLHRELNWLIQDSLGEGEPATLSCAASASSSGSTSSKKVVKLRTCLDDLYRLWKERIEDRRPFQYLVGCEHWRDLVLSVEEGVLIPRPETELIVDFVEDVLAENYGDGLKEGLWADLGTGSGALAIAIGRILGCNGRVIATDLSPVAVAVTEYNVKRYCLQDKVKVKQGSWFEPLEESEVELGGIVSNPPYIPSDNIAGLQAEVSKHEPILALDGGANGMKDLLHLCNGAASMLRPGGFFAFETNGEQQSQFLAGYMESELGGRLVDIKIESDLAGIPRFVKGFKAR
ncbi:OLC1v1022327C1 [Oldenlandia corymbosa var. corymbosa]|uniref:OLC1v1022327C1 n=1 Tax=Oldenlandia corymbosa var. corymbosa TaxID=529605 RepID=A0AAV1BXM5_OLDCO|nr:OLC1v1022327C1 [Oldenlandia corymbosa var. corymbosa]